MECTLVKDLYRKTSGYINNNVQVAGWVRTVRTSKNFGFIELNDGSFFKNVQIVFDNTLDNFESVNKLTISSSIIVNGKLIKTENAKHATNPTRDGETTALYLARLLEDREVKVTRIAHGLPIGSNIDYADELTLLKSLEGRTKI